MNNIEEYKLKELKLSEQKNIAGGSILGAAAAGLVIAAGAAVINDWDNFERGFTGRPYKD